MNIVTQPTVEILLAVYRPDPAFFRALLRSLDNQSYPSLRLSLLDDSGDDAQHQAISDMAKECLTAHPYWLQRNAQNQGVLRTFERLTRESTGDLVAYADQDDLWMPQKLSRLAALVHTDTPLAYCNLSIIDGQGALRHETLQDMNARFTHRHGVDLFSYFLTDNCIPGCTLLMDGKTARAALPFPDAYVHDHWLALWASSRGRIGYDAAPLILYRLHGNNVIGMQPLAGVTDRLTYVNQRLLPQLAMLDAARRRFQDPAQQAEIERRHRALAKRIAYIENRKLYHLPALMIALRHDLLRMGLEGLLGLSTERFGQRLIAFAKKH